MEWFLIFAIPEGIIYFIFVLLLGVASTGILNVILGLIGFGVNVVCLCIFADALYSIFSEGEYLKIFQLIISGAVLVWMFSILFTSCADEKVVTYETNDVLDYKVSEGAKELSGGMKQRLALSRAFLHTPKMFIFDEITANLDERATHMVLDSIEAYAKEIGAGIVWSYVKI